MFDYVIGTSGDSKETRNFLIADIAQFVINLIGGAKTWYTIEVTEDGDEITSEALIGVESVDWIIGQNTIYSTAGSGITLDSETGTITGISVFVGEKYVIGCTRTPVE